MAKDFEVIINDPDRRADFIKIFGRDRVNVTSPLPEWAELPTIGKAPVYKMDLNLLTLNERLRLVGHLAQKFNIPADEVARDLEKEGVPILAQHCTVVVYNPQRWL